MTPPCMARDDGEAPELDLLEDAVPHLRMLHDPEGVAVLVLGKVEPGAEVLAVAGEHHGLGVRRGRLEEALEARDQGVVDGVALRRPVEAHDRERAALLDREMRQRRLERADRRVHALSTSSRMKRATTSCGIGAARIGFSPVGSGTAQTRTSWPSTASRPSRKKRCSTRKVFAFHSVTRLSTSRMWP